nr:expansin-B15-like [Tanacetum cinerariifolium]
MLIDMDIYEDEHANVHAWYHGHGNHGYGRPYSPALGTWYGDPNGAGSGGACGLANDIKCTTLPYCSQNPIRLTITDECPGACNDVPFHFDLSGTAFGAMARSGYADKLRNLGQVEIQFRRVQCYYGRTKIAFKTDTASNPNWFAMAIESDAGDGGLRSVEIAPAGTHNFVQMTNTWGAVWAANIDPSFRAPFSFRLVSLKNKMVVAENDVPANFVPGQIYSSNVNFWK